MKKTSVQRRRLIKICAAKYGKNGKPPAWTKKSAEALRLWLSMCEFQEKYSYFPD
jgi:hypothetical protein